MAVKEDVSFEELSIHKEKYNLLDVRKVWERDEFNIGGQHIPLAELVSRISEVYILTKFWLCIVNLEFEVHKQFIF
jgi:hypothetical protein